MHLGLIIGLLTCWTLTIANESCDAGTHTQITNTVLMIPPNESSMYYDPETSTDNKFMHNVSVNLDTLLIEWNAVVNSLKENSINVITASHDKIQLKTPNCLFPNNWLSTHNDMLTIYPMKWPNRRLEIRNDIIDQLNFQMIHDMTSYVEDNLYLEGTGSLVLDRQMKIAYLSISERASAELAVIWAKQFDYQLVLFKSVDIDGDIIYHTNVVMSVGSTYVIICIECIKGNNIRKYIIETIKNSQKELIEITQSQMSNYCGNVLEVGLNDNKILMMSDRAYNHFTDHQRDILQNKHQVKLIHPSIPVIETMFGGGVRCLIAEIFKSDD